MPGITTDFAFFLPFVNCTALEPDFTDVTLYFELFTVTFLPTLTDVFVPPVLSPSSLPPVGAFVASGVFVGVTPLPLPSPGTADAVVPGVGDTEGVVLGDTEGVALGAGVEEVLGT